MRVLSYLVLLLMFSVASAQTPTILQGDYISNVFGNSNFILNPNAQTSNCTTSGTITCANVTVTNASITRVTTTPLVARTEFNVAITSANGTATWATRAFDAGMKGQNCEARFTYRGFAATSKVHIKQSTNTVASLNLTPATDPRIASINFPCGDLSTATTFVVTDTAILAGTNEIGGIYLGLATNMANVAQAEFVGGGEWNAVVFSRSSAAIQSTFAAFTSGSAGTAVGKATSAGSDSTITFSYLPAGQYHVSLNLYAYGYALNSSFVDCQFSIQEIDSNTYSGLASTGAYPNIVDKYPAAGQLQGNFTFSTAGQRRFRIVSKNAAANGASSQCNVLNESAMKAGIYVYRFPTSSELVVTPERQNTFAAGQWTGGISFGRSSTAEITISNAVFSTNRTLFGKAEFTTTANDVAIKVPQMPPGTYRIELTGNFANYLNTAGTLDSNCSFFLKDGTNTAVARSQQYGSIFQKDSVSTATAIVKYTSTADRTFTASLASGTANNTECLVFEPKIIITPLDQPSNSALYVQGPVLGAQTGAAIPAGYQMEGITTVTNTITGVTSSTHRTGTGVTLQPGVWLIDIYTLTANTAPTISECGITKTVDSVSISDDRSWPTRVEVSDAGNVGSAKECKSYGYFRITTPTVFYPTNFVNSPGASNYQITFRISAIRLN